jgi:hypothetical protein
VVRATPRRRAASPVLTSVGGESAAAMPVIVTARRAIRVS